ncbi:MULTISPECIES: UDP-N-acetylmuramoyl-L-alanine--D-glutamate ligase [Capnocytophaga]|jgi:UDP-N-acetylmuramoyl-L-alanine--D-glutamate ligase|uniref:UDP-N-acetylmuramoyl-L-alanine--D-glutamate ligase n=1 Tax=Capnocytophaga TaxID=1016 RepID=UPI0002A3CFCA|nr:MULTISPECIES: UDP-N-acetylmuramoyl-L-alanine--D-glutamate ligase [Capnocytophaga]EKY09911.1 UDP-N-acetylmuramoyl-L-alanine--D-glutamate ligase [Capnocytophaga sp. oral taxon 332 str. F0381]
MKRLAILGGGESGVGTAILAKQKGWEVFLSDRGNLKPEYRKQLDDEGIAYEEGKHTEDKILGADCIMKSPGIPDKAPIVVKARERGIAVISEIEFAAQYTDKPIIAITGSNGKTTTTMLTYHLLKEAGLSVGLGGNIGYSFAELVAHSNPDYYVLEISSFQLDGIATHFAPHIAMLLNITPDHLDRYNYQFENYIASKFRIAMNQTANDYLIYDADDEVIADWLRHHKVAAKLLPFTVKKEVAEGAYLKDNKIYMKIDEKTTEIEVDEISLKGIHNVKNTMAATIAARLLAVRDQSLRQSLKGFKGADHRLEEVKVVDGVTYVNDSKATNVNSVFFALDTIKTPIVWIVGGQDKGNDYQSLMPYVQEKVKAIVCLGVDNTPLLRSFASVMPNLVETRSMEEAVRLAKHFAASGDTVLLSPACASFDLFDNYEHRGNMFKEAVAKL